MAKKNYFYQISYSDYSDCFIASLKYNGCKNIPADVIFSDSKSTIFGRLLDRPFQSYTDRVEIIYKADKTPLVVYAVYKGMGICGERYDNIISVLFLDKQGHTLKSARAVNDYLMTEIGIGLDNKHLVSKLSENETFFQNEDRVSPEIGNKIISGLARYVDLMVDREKTKKMVRYFLYNGYAIQFSIGDNRITTSDYCECFDLIDKGYEPSVEKEGEAKLFPFFTKDKKIEKFVLAAEKLLKYCGMNGRADTVKLLEAIDEFANLVKNIDAKHFRNTFILYSELTKPDSASEIKCSKKEACAECSAVLGKAAKLYLQTEHELYFLCDEKIWFPVYFNVEIESEQEMLRLFSISQQDVKIPHLNADEDSYSDEEIPF